MVEFCPYRSLTEALRYSSLVERARWQEFDGYLAAKLGVLGAIQTSPIPPRRSLKYVVVP